MTYRLEHQPFNREGHRAWRPWLVVDAAGRLFQRYTTQEIALAVLELLHEGAAYSRHEIYRRMNLYGTKGRNARQARRTRAGAPHDEAGQPLPGGG